MATLNLTNIHKAFGDTRVVHGVDLEVRSGEFTVFVGPSGCGKSTLLRMIAGLETVSEGTVEIDGRDVTAAEPSERGVTMVFQSYALYPHMSVYDNMGFALRMNGADKDEIDRKVREAAGILGLDKLLDRKPKALSGGQRQRVAIGRSIVREPKIFLFDEPLSNLDAELRVQMRLEIARLHSELDATMIYVTHDQVEAMTLADRIVILRDGLIEQVGPPQTLYRDPDNMFVAGFIGSPKMNFLKGRVAGVTAAKKTGAGTTGRTAKVEIESFPGTDIVAKLGRGGACKAGRKVLVGVRPEHFAEGGKVSLQADVSFVENLGSTSYAYASAPDGTSMTVGVAKGRSITAGKANRIAFDAGKAFLFDRETGMRI